jgi:hypothetical protein
MKQVDDERASHCCAKSLVLVATSVSRRAVPDADRAGIALGQLDRLLGLRDRCRQRRRLGALPHLLGCCSDVDLARLLKRLPRLCKLFLRESMTIAQLARFRDRPLDLARSGE